jgi:hypothetical protein
VRSLETGKPLVTYQALAESFGDPARRNGQNFFQECAACEADLTAYGRRKRKVAAAVVAAVTAEVRPAPLASASVLGQRVAGRFPRAELRPANIHAALEQMSCPVMREPLGREWEAGVFQPQEEGLLQEALAGWPLPSRPRARPVAERLAEAGIHRAAEAAADTVVQPQQAERVAALLPPGLAVSQIPARIRVMVVAMTLSSWKVPLSRLGLGGGEQYRRAVGERTGRGAVSGRALLECGARPGRDRRGR